MNGEFVPKFKLGQVVSTPGALEKAQKLGIDLMSLLVRHVTGDWGDLSNEDKKENDFSVDKRLRLMSSYKISKTDKIWIITEADRSVTAFLLPEEY